MFEYDFNTNTGNIVEIISGDVKISRNINVFTIEFDCITSKNEIIKGKYNGSLLRY